MNVLVISDPKGPLAVVEIPEGKTLDETYVAWYREGDPDDTDTDEEILNHLSFDLEELEVEKVF